VYTRWSSNPRRKNPGDNECGGTLRWGISNLPMDSSLVLVEIKILNGMVVGWWSGWGIGMVFESRCSINN